MVHDDDSDTSYSGGGSSTDAGSGVTGDDGSNTSYGGGGSDTDAGSGSTGDTGGSSDGSGGSTGSSSDGGGDFGGGSDDDGGSDYDGGSSTDAGSGVTGGDGSDTTYSGGGSSTDAGSGVTGDDGSDTTYSGGSSDSDSSSGSTGGGDTDSTEDYDPNPSRREVGGADDGTLEDIDGTTDRPQSTGDEPGQNQDGSGGDATSGEFDSTFDDDLTADRGVSVTTVSGADAPSQLERSEALLDELGQEQSRAEQREQIAARLARENDVDRSNIRVGQAPGDQDFQAVIVEDEAAFEDQTAITGTPDPEEIRPAEEDSFDRGDRRQTTDNSAILRSDDSRYRTAAETASQPSPQAAETLNEGRRARYAAGIDVLLGSTDDAVVRALEANAEAQPGGAPFEAADAMFGSVDEAVGRAVRASVAGDPARAADNLAGGVDDAVVGAVSAGRTLVSNAPSSPGDGDDNILPGLYGDAVATGTAVGEDIPVRDGSDTVVPGIYGPAVATGVEIGEDVNEEIESAEINESTTDRLTRGGILSERDERRLSEAAEQFDSDVRGGVDDAAAVSPLTLSDELVRGSLEAAGVNTDRETTVDTPYGEAEIDTERRGEGNLERAQEAAGESIVTAVNPFALAQAGETGLEVSSNLDDEVSSGDAATAAVGSSTVAIGRETGEAVVERARSDPSRFAASLAGEAVLGAGAGRAAGFATRRTADRVRTAGGTRVDLEGVTNPETAAYYNDADADVGEEARFPGADDPDLYETDPAEAVRQQSDEYTPAVIEEQFEEAGVTEGTDLKKGIETEPAGPDEPTVGTGAGFRTQEGGYESPGAFAGPELSPNFLGVGERSYSFRPGLPGLGGRPTGVVARTEVENPDADTLDEFNRELVDERAGETTARTKPPGEVNTGEIEAVLPPEARFSAVDGVSSGGNRFGVGANFYTEVRGRRVPLRLVAPEDRVDAPGTEDVGETTEVSGEPLEYYARSGDAGTDRPLATPADVSTGGTASSEGTTETADATDDGPRSTTDSEDDLVSAQPRDSIPDDDLLGVRPRERESVDAGRTDGSAEDPDDGLTGVRVRDRDADSTRSDTSSDRADDDLLGVRPRDSDSGENTRSETSSESGDDLLGVRPRDSRSERRDRDDRYSGGPGSGSSGSGGRSDRDDGSIAPSIIPGPPGRGPPSGRGDGSSWGSLLTTSETPGGGEPGDGPRDPDLGPYPDTYPEPQPDPKPEPDRNQWDWNPDMDVDVGRTTSSPDESERPLSVGYYNEFVADFAFGAAPTRAPSQETLESFEGSEALIEQLPTMRELSAEGERRDALEAAYDTFGFAGVSVTSDDDGGGGIL